MRAIVEGQTFADFGPLGAKNRNRQQGRSFELGGGVNDKRKTTLIFTGAPNKSEQNIGDALASTLTFTCDFDPLATPAAIMPTIEGVARWGSDGHQTEARFDWKRGTVVQVCGSYLEVIAELVEPATEARVKVGAFVGYYATTRQVPTLTRYLAIPVAPGAGIATPMPAFAARLHVASALVTATYRVDIEDANGVVLSSYTQPPFLAGGSVPIPNNAAQARVTSSAAAFNAAVIWELAL